MHWDAAYFCFDLAPMIAMVVASELLIDYLKHIFVLRCVT